MVLGGSGRSEISLLSRVDILVVSFDGSGRRRGFFFLEAKLANRGSSHSSDSEPGIPGPPLRCPGLGFGVFCELAGNSRTNVLPSPLCRLISTTPLCVHKTHDSCLRCRCRPGRGWSRRSCATCRPSSCRKSALGCRHRLFHLQSDETTGKEALTT